MYCNFCYVQFGLLCQSSVFMPISLYKDQIACYILYDQEVLIHFYIVTYYIKWVKTSWAHSNEWRYPGLYLPCYLGSLSDRFINNVRRKGQCMMVSILDGNSRIGAHVRSNLCYLICLRYLIRSRAVTNRIFFSPKRSIFLHACAKFSN